MTAGKRNDRARTKARIAAAEAAERPWPEHADEVTDTWSGGVEALQGCWPFENFHPDAHEHGCHDGGFLAHEHEKGAEPHEHTYMCSNPGCHHIMMREYYQSIKELT